MITSFQQDILNRDIDQVKQWCARMELDAPPEWMLDLIVFDAFANIEESLEVLRNKLHKESKSS